MRFSRRGTVVAGLSLGLAGCVRAPRGASNVIPDSSGLESFPDLKPLDLAIENLTKITVCLRPFRPAGPRLEAEQRGAKLLVHNYGHGGSGWSLSWGYAEKVRELAAARAPREVAVLGAGAMGLTSATALAETGAKVTIYAREMPMESSSAKATGVWSPSSRIALDGQHSAEFPAQWELIARRSYARHMLYVGRAGHPVEFTPRFYVRSGAPEPALAQRPEGGERFAGLGRQLRGLTPPWSTREKHPFPATNGVRGGPVMTFNIAEYTRQLTQDFQAMGGRIVRAEIGSLEELSQLPGQVVVNCSGIEAQNLVGDDSLVPVRGQIAWMPAQLDRLYGVYHRGVMALSRRDGLLIQETGGSDYFGYGDASMEPDRQELLAARAKIAPMFEWG